MPALQIVPALRVFLYIDMQSMTTYNKDKNTRIDYINIGGSAMDKEIYSIEGIDIEVEKIDKTDADAVRRKMAYAFKMIRAQSGMNRKDFSACTTIFDD